MYCKRPREANYINIRYCPNKQDTYLYIRVASYYHNDGILDMSHMNHASLTSVS